MGNRRSILVSAAVASLWTVLFAPPVVAEEHIEDALKHTGEAAHSVGDSQSIGGEASEALKHIDAAKAAEAANPEALKHLRQSEEELNAAVTRARRFNSITATEAADTAKRHLEQAEDAAENSNGGAGRQP